MVKAKTRKSHSKAEDAVIRKRKDELRHAQDIRDHYMRKLDRTHNLYLQLNAFLGQLDAREKEIER
jgi:mitogen-activated protein kinase kinase kinase 13